MSNLDMPKLDLEYVCKHKKIKSFDNSIKYTKKYKFYDLYWSYDFNSTKITYEKAVCSDCSQNFIMITIPDYEYNNVSPLLKFISINNCPHPEGAFNVIKDTIKKKSSWWRFSKANTCWIDALGYCSLCDSKIYAKRKCTGELKDNEQVQIWSDWII